MRPLVSVLVSGVLGFALVQANTAWAVPPSYAYAMTAESFINRFKQPEPYTSLERDKAFSYLDGIKDASQGRVWCDVNQFKTPDMADHIVVEFSRMSAAERKRSAAPLILDILRRDYPCAGATGGKQ